MAASRDNQPSPPAHSSKGEKDAENIEEDEELTQYEKQRNLRIKENRARLEALRLPQLAASISLSSKTTQESKVRNNKKKRPSADDDNEYQPSDEDDGASPYENDDDGEENDDDDFTPTTSSRRTPKKKVKNKESLDCAKVKKKQSAKWLMEDSDIIDDDEALRQAIALSLEGATQVSFGGYSATIPTVDTADTSTFRKRDRNSSKNTPARRKRNQNVNRIQLTEDEVVAYFFSFDESGKGHITMRDLQRMAAIHDFTWTDQEIANMVYCFSSNRDAKLDLDDFRTIVTRCNMLLKSPKS